MAAYSTPSCRQPKAVELAMPAPPRVWLEHPNQQMSNVGDLAMLMMDVERTRVLYPEAVIQVPSRATEWVSRFCPGATRITASGLYHLAWRGLLPERLARIPSLYAVERRLILADTWRYLHVVDWRNLVRGQRDPHSALELAALGRSRVVIACGGGYLNDAFAGAANRCSKVLLAAQSRGIPTALMGQGLGPLENETTRGLVLATLNRSRFVGLREGRDGPALSAAAGVLSERMRVTGDGAIELAARERRDSLGDCIGFNVRVASYAQTESNRLGRLGDRPPLDLLVPGSGGTTSPAIRRPHAGRWYQSAELADEPVPAMGDFDAPCSRHDAGAVARGWMVEVRAAAQFVHPAFPEVPAQR
jgi:hypothetical protein